MIKIGIFARTFVRPHVEEVFDCVAGHGIRCVQFNFSAAGRATLPDEIDPALIERIRRAATVRGIALPAVSGTFNLVHPAAEVRRDGLRRLRVLAPACAALGARVVTLCTGTRDPDDMWRWHPENAGPDAWRDLVVSLREAIALARDAGVLVAVEPEAGNVVNTAQRARRLLDELESPELKIVMDPANLVGSGDPSRSREVLEEAFALLHDDIVLAHAKDVARDGASFAPAGSGLLDYGLYLDLLARSGYDGSLVLHSLGEDDVASAVAFLRSELAASSPAEA